MTENGDCKNAIAERLSDIIKDKFGLSALLTKQNIFNQGPDVNFKMLTPKQMHWQ